MQILQILNSNVADILVLNVAVFIAISHDIGGQRLADARLYGAIVGKAYYTVAIDLGEAIKEAKR